LQDKTGSAAVEMALVGSFVMLPFLGGITGLGQALMLQTKLDRALHGGVVTAYGQASTLTSSNVASVMATAVQNAYGSSSPSTTASLSYYCISPTGTRSGTAYSAPPSSCTSPNVVATYLVLSASVTFIPLLNIGIVGWNQTGGTGGTVTVTSSATVRIS
jgi:Flp pilus assembly protein TadG